MTFGPVFHDFLYSPWEVARGYLSEELAQLHGHLNAQVGGFLAAASEGSLVIGTSNASWDALVIGAADTVLKSDGTTASWGKVSLVNDIQGTLPVSHGGTGTTSFTNGRIPYVSGGIFVDDADLTFATDTLTATKIVGTTSVSTAKVILGDGTVSLPSLTFGSDLTTGFCYFGTSNAVWTAAGSASARFAAGITLRNAGSFGWTDTDNAAFGTMETLISRAAAQKINFTNAAATLGVGIDFSTDAVLKLRTRAQTGDAKLSALLTPPAGTATAGTAPLKFTSGTNLTTAEAGAIEFTTDDFFATITTGAARKAFILDDGARLTSGKIPKATTNGRLIDGPTPLAGTKTYWVSDTSGGAVTRKLTFTDGILTAET